MKKQGKRNLTNLRSLVVIVLVISVLFRGTTRDYLLFGACCVWALSNAIRWCWKQHKPCILKCKELSSMWNSRASQEQSPSQPVLSNILVRRNVEQHLTAEIQKVCPDTAWEWPSDYTLEQLFLTNKTKIHILNIDGYDEATVALTPSGAFDIQLVKIIDLSEIENGDRADSQNSADKVKTDMELWYSMVAAQKLQNIWTGLSAKGHKRLYLDDKGQVFTLNKKGKKFLYGKLERFPAKALWEHLISCFQNDGINACIDSKNNHITLKWGKEK